MCSASCWGRPAVSKACWASSPRPCFGPGRHAKAQCWFTNKTVSGFNLAAFSASYPEQAGRAIAAAAGRRLQVQVEALPLAEAVEAHRRSESGRTTGKLVLDMQR
ncbi:zinc-binding dehydrogenase [Nonomuraea fuscirosea]|uniref:zinc-binding dehydrogenase n=1 Tax=Nonomuraea fuscirosea TaxID=1291556 RepID=UPI002DD8C236|nr:zinc-binding dehydrogenase [Nonomuraea fuscirosea]WSA56870.1 zinc-binding dehydrogenase [Nonomuraea fuscirosea]